MDKKSEHKDSTLRVNKGIDQPAKINPGIAGRMKSGSAPVQVGQLYEGIIDGNRMMLGKAITLIESALPAQREAALELVENCLPHSGNSIRVGITGVPGVGKSSFIEALGTHLTKAGHRLAVLAIDPSSEKTKGSILGDKTRMEQLANDPNAFIRPSPSAGSLGGVARKTREAVILCEAAGFDTIFVETVGVGQSETAVHSMVDFFLLLMLAGAGDELQGIKRGIIEMADAVVINKADGDNIDRARRAKQDFTNALHLFPPSSSGWTPVVETCSAFTKSGITEVWDTILQYTELTKSNGFFRQKRQQQELRAMFDTIDISLKDKFYSHPTIVKAFETAKKKVLAGKASAYREAARLLEEYYTAIGKGEIG